jgi:signal transduction histidine kinase/putative methionine-R-sulfoxide reductase with GAF domain
VSTTEQNLIQQVQDLQLKLQRKQVEMNSIQQIGKALSSELRIKRLLPLIIDEVSHLMNAERSTFYIVDEERGQLWSIIAQMAEVLEIRLKIGVGIAGHVAQTGEVVNIKDAYNDPRFDPTTDKKTGYKTRSILTMPIFEPINNDQARPRIIGVLQILNKINGVFTVEDEELLSSMASQIAVTLINSRLYTALEKKIGEINLLYDIEQQLNQAFNLDELLNLLIDKIAETLKVQAALMLILDEQGVDFNRRVAKNINPELLKSCRFNLQEGLLPFVMNEGKMHVTNEAAADSLFKSTFNGDLGFEVKHLVCAPLKVGEHVTGFMLVFNKPEENEFFRSDDLRLIDSLSSQIARSIESYRLRDEKIKAERLASIGNMMSTIVHDLRTPMNNIYGFVDLMREETDNAQREEYAQIINEQIMSLNNMVTDVLDFSKGKTNILPVKCAVDKLLEAFRKTFEGEITRRGYHFEIINNARSMIYVDPEKVNRVFMNIMKNALEAMEKGGTFKITTNQVDGEVEFLLSDTGSGIPEEIRDRLFDSFVTSGKEGGTGLGLAIVKKIVEEHKGRIEVESFRGQGTTFKIYLKRI